MTPSDFNALFYEDKLLLVEPHAPKVTTFLTWNLPLRNISIYAVENFYAELVFNMEKRKVEAINAFETVDYLSKYRSFMSPVEGALRGLLNDKPLFES